MTLGTFKDLCIDGNDAGVLGRFWAAALGLEFRRKADGNAVLTGPTPAHTIWINQVPEPKTAKHRIHLDVHGATAADLEAIGASVVDAASFKWTAMADPEGGEFCMFPRVDPPGYRLYEVCVDCTDHEAMSSWWAAAIGGERVVDPLGYSYLTDIPNVPFETLDFLPVPEPKTAKNRIHLDLLADDVDAFVATGATLVRAPDDEIEWHVLADPEGNEFCVFTSD